MLEEGVQFNITLYIPLLLWDGTNVSYLWDSILMDHDNNKYNYTLGQHLYIEVLILKEIN
jgi:hypothetical protein